MTTKTKVTRKGGGGMNKLTSQGRSRPKKKSIKAKTINMGSERKRSRMGKQQKRGKSGPNAHFVTRSKAVKMLQLPLKDFRRLCILKGIYPREPKKKTHGKDKTYYHAKDIAYLSHEPILHKFLEMKAFMKKVRRKLGKNEHAEARRMYEKRPTYTLDHLVRERYPRFSDAISDLDDALTLMHMFARLPKSYGTDSNLIDKSQVLCREWQAWVARNHALRKVFVSVKGVYYEAEVHGSSVVWIVPHQFVQHVPKDVDMRVMTTFLEFYETLLGFVLFKLYHELGMKYPPTLSTESDAFGEHLTSLKFEKLSSSSPTSSTSSTPSSVTSTHVRSTGTKQTQNGEGDQNQGQAPNEERDNSSEQGAAKKEVKGEKGKANAKAKARKAQEKRSSLDSRLNSLQEKLKDMKEETEEEDEDEVEGKTGAAAETEESRRKSAKTANQFGFNNSDDEEDDGDDDDDNMNDAPGTNGTIDFADDADAKAIQEREKELQVYSGLFKGLKFFVSREVPYELLEMAVLSFGGDITRDEKEKQSPRITHYVTDRLLTSTNDNGTTNTISTREYVQPQWVFDSINSRILLPVARYHPNTDELPPHLSPFVEPAEGDHVPDYAREIESLRALRAAQSSGDASTLLAARQKMEALTQQSADPKAKRAIHDRSNANVDDESDDESDDEEDSEGDPEEDSEQDLEQDSEEDHEEEEEEEEEKSAESTQDEMRERLQTNIPSTRNDVDANSDVKTSKTPSFVKSSKFRGAKPGYVFCRGARGVGYYLDKPPKVEFDASAARAASKREQRRQDVAEERQRAEIVMSKKAKHLYGRMKRGIERKQEKTEKLKRKRDQIAAEKESQRKSQGTSQGKSPGKSPANDKDKETIKGKEKVKRKPMSSDRAGSAKKQKKSHKQQ